MDIIILSNYFQRVFMFAAKKEEGDLLDTLFGWLKLYLDIVPIKKVEL